MIERSVEKPLTVLVVVGCLLSVCGCQSLRTGANPLGRGLLGGPQATQSAEANDFAGAESEPKGFTAAAKQSGNRVVSYLSGREPLNKERAKELYQEGDAVFRQGVSEPRAEAKKTFAKAAKLFLRAAEAHPDSAIEQDALMMAGESLFFADKLTEAEDVFARLQKEHPRNRHNDRVAARLFEISRYWIETDKAGNRSWMPVNFFDPSRP
ncbi:MAG: tetratricopeptide repeat protein, partial [Pirellulaceae bacterium]